MSLLDELKQQADSPRHGDCLDELLNRYGVRSWIAGCTEMHILARRCGVRGHTGRAASCIDPLTILAAEMYDERGVTPV